MATKITCDRCGSSRNVTGSLLDEDGVPLADLCPTCAGQVSAEIIRYRHKLVEQGLLRS